MNTTERPVESPRHRDDQEALQHLFDALLAAWTRGDAAAYADLFAPDVTYVGFDGYAFTSRQELRASHDELFRGVLFGSRLQGTIESTRFLADDVAVLHTRGAVVTKGRSKPGRGRESVQTLVAARLDQAWTFTDFHNSRYRPLPRVARWWMRHAAEKRQHA